LIYAVKKGETMWLRKHLALGTSLVVILGLILVVSSCSLSQQNPRDPEEQRIDISYLRSAIPSEVDNSELPVTPTEDIHTTGVPPEVDIEQYRLTIGGLVDKEVSLDYDTILAYPTVTDVVLLICPGFFVDNAEWTGVPVTTLLGEAGIKPEAKQVVFHAIGSYNIVLPLEEVQGDGVFLAHTVNGEILPKEHGFPLRLVVTGEYGSYWVKWVERIEVR
jgi:DMSO/TMAO reductase YedYZ molybdopterin-dependent catalytic subunit